MAKAIPKWVMERFSVLWKRYGNKPLSYVDIEKVLSLDDRNVIGVFLNELKKAEWIIINIDPNDSRRRIYELRTPEKVIGEIEYDHKRSDNRVSR